MSMEDFDIDGAVETLGSEMGFGSEEGDVQAENSGAVETSAPVDGATPQPAAATGATAPQPAPAPVPGTPPGTPPADVPPAPTASPVSAAPRTWRPDAAASWATLPVRVQEEILKREDDIFQGLEGYKADAQIGKAVNTIFQPFREIARMDNLDPGHVLNEAFQMHTTLSRGTEAQKQAALTQLASRYGLSLPSADPDSAPYVDPQVARLQEQVQSLQSQLSGHARQQEEHAQRVKAEQLSKIESEVQAFAADPANPDFEILSEEITKLFQAGRAKTLREAYDMAVYLHPTTRQKAIDGAAAAKLEAEKKSQAEAAAKAKAATSANVRTQAKNASGTAASGSMDDTLNDTYAKLMGQ